MTNVDIMQEKFSDKQQDIVEDNRNLIDIYKHMSVEDIKSTLQKSAIPFAFCMMQLESDFNIGTILRSANAFNFREGFYYGRKKFDRRGCVGVHNYTDFNYINDFDSLLKLKNKYKFVALEKTNSSIDIRKYQWKENSMIIIGEERSGIPQNVLDISDDVVHIPMFGSVRSFNAASAASMCFFDIVGKHM